MVLRLMAAHRQKNASPHTYAYFAHQVAQHAGRSSPLHCSQVTRAAERSFKRIFREIDAQGERTRTLKKTPSEY
jgi:hypothetical protein